MINTSNIKHHRSGISPDVPMRTLGLAGIIIMANVVATPGMAACDLAGGQQANVLRVLDGETIILSDHRQVRLINAAPARVPLGPEQANERALAVDAMSVLTQLVSGKSIVLRYGGRRTDRYGRLLAHVYLSDGKWVQGVMVSRGMSRAYSFYDNHACIEDLLFRETMARRAGIGLWGVKKYQVKSAGNIKELRGAPNRFQLVEGRVLRVAKVAGRIFLNFDKDWKKDFTITIAPSSVKEFTKARVDLRAMVNRKIRVRGWIELRNGPSIEVTHPAQIEFVNADTSTSHNPPPR